MFRSYEVFVIQLLNYNNYLPYQIAISFIKALVCIMLHGVNIYNMYLGNN